MECNICIEKYDDQLHSPRVLPCGHTHCDSCISRIMHSTTIACPVCKSNHECHSSTAFPLNFMVVALIEDAKSRSKDHQCFQHENVIGSFCKTCSSPTCEDCWEEYHSVDLLCKKIDLKVALEQDIKAMSPLLCQLTEMNKDKIKNSEETLKALSITKLSLQNALWSVDEDERNLTASLGNFKQSLEKIMNLKDPAESRTTKTMLDSLAELKNIKSQDMLGKKEKKLDMEVASTGILKLYPRLIEAMKSLLVREQDVYLSIEKSVLFIQIYFYEEKVWLRTQANKQLDSVSFVGDQLLDCFLQRVSGIILELDMKNCKKLTVYQLKICFLDTLSEIGTSLKKKLLEIMLKTNETVFHLFKKPNNTLVFSVKDEPQKLAFKWCEVCKLSEAKCTCEVVETNKMSSTFGSDDLKTLIDNPVASFPLVANKELFILLDHRPEKISNAFQVIGFHNFDLGSLEKSDIQEWSSKVYLTL